MSEQKQVKDLGIHFGALADPFDEQLEKQGFTATDKAIEKITRLNQSRLYLLFGNCLTDSENDRICKKILNQLKKSVRPKG